MAMRAAAPPRDNCHSRALLKGARENFPRQPCDRYYSDRSDSISLENVQIEGLLGYGLGGSTGGCGGGGPILSVNDRRSFVQPQVFPRVLNANQKRQSFHFPARCKTFP